MSTKGGPNDMSAVEQTLSLSLRATKRQIALVMRTPGGDWEDGGRTGSFSVPLAGGMVIEVDGEEGEWWVSAADILNAVLGALAAEEKSAATANCQVEGGPHGA